MDNSLATAKARAQDFSLHSTQPINMFANKYYGHGPSNNWMFYVRGWLKCRLLFCVQGREPEIFIKEQWAVWDGLDKGVGAGYKLLSRYESQIHLEATSSNCAVVANVKLAAPLHLLTITSVSYYPFMAYGNLHVTLEYCRTMKWKKAVLF